MRLVGWTGCCVSGQGQGGIDGGEEVCRGDGLPTHQRGEGLSLREEALAVCVVSGESLCEFRGERSADVVFDLFALVRGEGERIGDGGAVWEVCSGEVCRKDDIAG